MEWLTRDEKDITDSLIDLAKQIVPYHMAHNAEAEACDLLMEIEHMELLKMYVDENTYPRVCLYLTRYDLEHLPLGVPVSHQSWWVRLPPGVPVSHQGWNLLTNTWYIVESNPNDF